MHTNERSFKRKKKMKNGRMDVLHKPFPYTTCQMRGHVNHEITLICETKQNEKVLFDRVNDKRKIEKFSNHILYTQRET